MTRFWKSFLSLSFVLAFAVSSFAQTTPQGRLSLSSTAAVITSDVVGATSIYYLPFVGSTVPIPTSSTALTNYQIPAAGLSVSLATGLVVSGGVFDVYIMLRSGSPWLCISPEWYSSSERHPATGSSGYSDIVQNQGIWIYGGTGGTSNMGCKNGSTGVVVSPYTATYLGSFIGGASVGTTSVQFKPAPANGGASPFLGLYNAYNRIRSTSQSLDSNGSWTNSSTTMGPADASDNNRIVWIDGLGQSIVDAVYQCYVEAPAYASGVISLGFDATNLPTGAWGVVGGGTAAVAGSTVARDTYIGLGQHYVQAMERLSGGSTPATFVGGSYGQLLSASLEN